MSENLITENEHIASETPTDAAETTTATVDAANANEAAKVEQSAGEVARGAAVVKIEGQEFPLDVAIAKDDNLLKAALSPHYPSIKNAQISRGTRAGQMIVSIVKRAEHKGVDGEGRQ